MHTQISRVERNRGYYRQAEELIQANAIRDIDITQASFIGPPVLQTAFGINIVDIIAPPEEVVSFV